MSKQLATLLAVSVLATAALVYFLTQSAPPPAGMVPEDTTSIEEGAPLAEVIVPAEFTGDAILGERAFNAKCAVCHGKNAAGQNGVAPPLVHIIYEPRHHGDGAFLYAVQNGVQSHHWNFGNMPVIEGLSGADVKAITAYVRQLQRANGIN